MAVMIYYTDTSTTFTGVVKGSNIIYECKNRCTTKNKEERVDLGIAADTITKRIVLHKSI